VNSLALLILALPRSAVLEITPSSVAQADILRAMRRDIVQGYVFAAAMLENEFLTWTSHARGHEAKSVA